MHGLACDNLLAAELVTADGEILHVDDATDPDLMWGLRGGGGNFGVVTSFTYRLHPVGPVPGGVVFFPGERAPEVLRLYRDLGAVAPRELSLVAVQVTAPPAPFVPEELRGRPVVGLSAAWFGDPEDGDRMLSPHPDRARPAGDRPARRAAVLRPAAVGRRQRAVGHARAREERLPRRARRRRPRRARRSTPRSAATRCRTCWSGGWAGRSPTCPRTPPRSRTGTAAHMTTIVGVWDARRRPGTRGRVGAGDVGVRPGGWPAAPTSTTWRTRAPPGCARPTRRPRSSG